MNLTEGYFPAQADTDYRERTIEDVLREQAATRPDSKALREVRYVLEQSGSEAVYYQPNVRGSALRPIVDEAAAGLSAAQHIIDIEDHGDLGSISARGYVKITGRVKEMIIRGGENLFPAEIEAALLEHPAIAECAVAGVPDEKWGEIVTAFLRLAEGAQRPDDQELRSFIRERLSPQKPLRIGCG